MQKTANSPATDAEAEPRTPRPQRQSQLAGRNLGEAIEGPIEGIESFRLDPEEFQRFADYVEQELGIHLPPHRRPMLEGRMARRLRQLNLRSAAEYWDYLFHSPESHLEKIEFFDAVTTNKTDFFREPAHFEILTTRVIPEWHARSGVDTFHLWCAASSTGEEPYTLAMMMSEAALQFSGFDFRILATDISTRVLRRAVAATYDEQLIAPVPLPLRRKYLLRSRDPHRREVRIRSSLRNHIEFQRLNLMDSTYDLQGRMFDAVFLRNVLIYFERHVQLDVITKVIKRLHPGGHLFVGHSDSLVGMTLPLKLVAPAVYRKVR